MKVKAGISEQFSGVELRLPQGYTNEDLRQQLSNPLQVAGELDGGCNWQRFEHRLKTDEMTARHSAPRVHDYKVTVKWSGGRLSEVFTSERKAEGFVCKLADRAWCNFISDGACDSFKDFETKITSVPRFKEGWELTSKQQFLLGLLCNSVSGPIVRDNNGLAWRLVDKKAARGSLSAGQFGGGLSSLKRAGFYNKGWVRIA